MAAKLNDQRCDSEHCLSRPFECTRRRSFLKTLGWGALVLLWPPRAFAKKLAIKLDKIPQLNNVGGFVILQIKGKEVLFIRDTATTVRAVDPICTHQKTRVGYDPKLKLISCSKHGSRYALNGKVVKGPSQSPLTPIYVATLDSANNRIILEMP